MTTPSTTSNFYFPSSADLQEAISALCQDYLAQTELSRKEIPRANPPKSTAEKESAEISARRKNYISTLCSKLTGRVPPFKTDFEDIVVADFIGTSPGVIRDVKYGNGSIGAELLGKMINGLIQKFGEPFLRSDNGEMLSPVILLSSAVRSDLRRNLGRWDLAAKRQRIIHKIGVALGADDERSSILQAVGKAVGIGFEYVERIEWGWHDLRSHRIRMLRQILSSQWSIEELEGIWVLGHQNNSAEKQSSTDRFTNSKGGRLDYFRAVDWLMSKEYRPCSIGQIRERFATLLDISPAQVKDIILCESNLGKRPARALIKHIFFQWSESSLPDHTLSELRPDAICSDANWYRELNNQGRFRVPYFRKGLFICLAHYSGYSDAISLLKAANSIFRDECFNDQEHVEDFLEGESHFCQDDIKLLAQKIGCIPAVAKDRDAATDISMINCEFGDFFLDSSALRAIRVGVLSFLGTKLNQQEEIPEAGGFARTTINWINGSLGSQRSRQLARGAHFDSAEIASLKGAVKFLNSPNWLRNILDDETIEELFKPQGLMPPLTIRRVSMREIAYE